jgi:hypothetical protein
VKLVETLDGEMKLADLMAGVGLTDRKHFRAQY